MGKSIYGQPRQQTTPTVDFTKVSNVITNTTTTLHSILSQTITDGASKKPMIMERIDLLRKNILRTR